MRDKKAQTSEWFDAAKFPNATFKSSSVEKTEKGYSVNCITLFGEERDKELATCRIHLNIHHKEDCHLFESARCELWLQAGVPIISEHSLDNDSRCTNVSYDELVETAVTFIQRMKE
jgi:hypothetical protein